MNVLDELIVLDESILDDEAPCVVCGVGADYRCAMRCCGHADLMCDSCLTKRRADRPTLIIDWYCGHCNAYLGIAPMFDECVKVTPI